MMINAIPKCLAASRARGSSAYLAVYKQGFPLFNTAQSVEDSQLQP